jgi:hypothetical protein
MDMDAQLSRFPAQAGQLASLTTMYFVYGNIIGSPPFLLKKKKREHHLTKIILHNVVH